MGSGGDSAEPSGREPERLVVTTGGEGGIYFAYGAAYAKVISEHLEGFRASAQGSTGAVENLMRLRDGKADIALTLGDTALDAVEGREAFDEPVPLAALAQIYRSYVHVVALEGSGIRALSDLKGKRVSVGSADSGTEVVSDRVLKLARIDSHKDIKREQLGVAESAAALESGALDAFFWSGGLPTSAVSDLARAKPVTMLDVSAFARPLRARYGGVYEDAAIPAGTYPGVDAAGADDLDPQLHRRQPEDERRARARSHRAAVQVRRRAGRRASGVAGPRSGARRGGHRADPAAPRRAAVLRPRAALAV